MALKTRTLVTLAIAIIVFYAACQKSIKTTSQTDNSQVGAQLAVTLYKSLTGVYGGNSIANGIKTPYQVAPNNRGPRINSITTSSCGNALDTVLSYITHGHDTTQNYLQHIKYTLICNGILPVGYITTDSVGITNSATLFSNNVTVVQAYTVQAIDTTYKHISMSGSIDNNTAFNTLNSSSAVVEYHKINSHYILTSYMVDVSAGISVISSGVSTFTAIQSDLSSGTPVGGSVINYAGTITFLGNNNAKITFTINSGAPQSYLINVITGVSTPTSN